MLVEYVDRDVYPVGQFPASQWEYMRQLCTNLREVIIDSGHWMAQEKPFAVKREIARWIFRKVSTLTHFEDVSQI